ncbi:MAG TPA: radical SAM protein [Stellaceae bacterium]|nr:radical SAM protein [Stellaceae bacterium]
MRSPVSVKHERRVLCVFPRYAPSFGTFEHAYSLTDGVRAFMPPQGLLTIAAYLPATWQVRFVDENIRPASDADFAWADTVLVSGMHVQHEAIVALGRRARGLGKVSVLGGPSVSACPEHYPEFDYLHVGELGDATDALIAALDTGPRPPPRQRVFTTEDRLALTDFPLPAYEMIEGRRYFLGSVQFSSGCPYRCEFCDIPTLYGRQPRYKTPQQVIAELEAMLAAGICGSVYFVDDNFIGNKKAARELLPVLIDWQKARGYPLRFSCEATLNIAACPDILAMMREATFYAIFCGIETPELDALDAIDKGHNHHALPILDAIQTINDYGMEVVSGIILGLDTDTPATVDNLLEFIEASHIPLLTINLLQALPKTPLHARLAAAGRIDDSGRYDSNVVFARPYDQVLADWRYAIRRAYSPAAVYARFAWHAAHTYPKRLRPKLRRAQLNLRNLRRGLVTLAKIIGKVGISGDYRRTFWRFAWPAVKAGRIEDIIASALVAHHLITFARGCAQQNAAFFSGRTQPAPAAARGQEVFTGGGRDDGLGDVTRRAVRAVGDGARANGPRDADAVLRSRIPEQRSERAAATAELTTGPCLSRPGVAACRVGQRPI